jgi:hypothetical protein
MSDLAEWRVHGSVLTVEQESADGRVSAFEFHNPDGSVPRWTRVLPPIRRSRELDGTHRLEPLCIPADLPSHQHGTARPDLFLSPRL